MSNIVDEYEVMRKFDLGSFDKRIRDAKKRAIGCMERNNFSEAIANCIYALELQAGMVEAEHQHDVVSMLASLEDGKC